MKELKTKWRVENYLAILLSDLNELVHGRRPHDPDNTQASTIELRIPHIQQHYAIQASESPTQRRTFEPCLLVSAMLVCIT